MEKAKKITEQCKKWTRESQERACLACFSNTENDNAEIFWDGLAGDLALFVAHMMESDENLGKTIYTVATIYAHKHLDECERQKIKKFVLFKLAKQEERGHYETTKNILNKDELNDRSIGGRIVSCDEPYDVLTEEYTDINQLWHDAAEEPHLGEDIIALDCDGISVAGIYKDYTGFYKDYNGKGLYRYHSFLCEWDAVVKWAYIKDLLPKGGLL